MFKNREPFVRLSAAGHKSYELLSLSSLLSRVAEGNGGGRGFTGDRPKGTLQSGCLSGCLASCEMCLSIGSGVGVGVGVAIAVAAGVVSVLWRTEFFGGDRKWLRDL